MTNERSPESFRGKGKLLVGKENGGGMVKKKRKEREKMGKEKGGEKRDGRSR